VLAPVLALLLVFGIYPKLLTRSIDPATCAAIEQVRTSQPCADVGGPLVPAAAEVRQP
jgi:NADH:ubiquinone oxidoreductase subunit 4 (subunit M)